MNSKMNKGKRDGRLIKATHGLKENTEDSAFEVGLADFLKKEYKPAILLEMYKHYIHGNGKLDTVMRRAFWRAMTKQFGQGVQIGSGADFKHIETFEIGNNVFIGANTYVQGRHDGKCVIGDNTWIGPNSYFDARDLVIGNYVGWGPGAMVLGSAHTGKPLNIPIIQTDLEIKPVRVEDEADIGTNAVILPGVTIGKGSMVGAGAVVTEDVAPYAVAAGVPAKFKHWRDGYRPNKKEKA